MFKKMPIRIRLMSLTIFILTICCVGLTIILNLSANKMANVMEAIPLVLPPNVEDLGDLDQNKDQTPIEQATKTNEAKEGFRLDSIFYLIIIIIIGGILNYYLSGKTLEPLKTLSSQMKNRNVHNLAEEIKLPLAKDELLTLTKSFNEMTHTLNESFLMEQRFSQNAAHELRTPLTVIKTKIEVFQMKQNHSIKEYDELLEVINNQNNHLTSIVKNLLNLTFQKNIKMDETISISETLEKTISDLKPLLDEKNITISINKNSINFLGNYNLFYQACFNILENAIRYNQINGKININILSNKKEIIIDIKDTGIGISEENYKAIFEPFYQIDNSRSKKSGGSGLGLAIVKSIIEKHLGNISVKRNKPNGTIFQITLPNNKQTINISDNHKKI